MARWKLTIEYDGRPFVGWQRQDNGPSVQQAIETAIMAFCHEEVRLFCAGRTDAGVHARGQVAHCDIARPCRSDTVRDALNHHLHAQSAPVAIVQAEAVEENFHARLSCLGRRYCYRIITRRAPPVLELGRVWHVAHVLDATAMHEAAQVLVGHHDFTTFRASQCQASGPVKTLDRLDVCRDGDDICIHAAARSFLHHQVRNMVGTLERVGAGRWSVADVAAALAARDRCAGGPTAPAGGLYFMAAVY